MSPKAGLIILVGLVPAACAVRPTAPLAKFGQSEILLQVGLKAPGSVSVTVNIVSMDPRCPGVTDNAWVEVAGQRLGANQRGGAAENKGGQKICQPSIFSGTLPPSEAAAVPVLIGDDSATWTVQVTRLLAARQMTIANPTSGHLQRGAQTTVSVGEATDGTATGDVAFIPSADANAAAAFSMSLSDPGFTTVTGTTVSFNVPLSAPLAAGLLRFAGDLEPTIQACSGPSSCVVSLGITLTVPASIDS